MKDSIFHTIQQGLINRIHFQGDSITQGCGFVSQRETYVHALIEKIEQLSGNHNMQLYNHAVGGATSLDGLNRIHWCQREDRAADLTFIMFGLNDIHQDLSIEEYSQNLRGMVESLQKIPCEIVMLSPTPYLSRAEEVRAFRDCVERMSHENGLAYVDCLGPFYETGDVPDGILWPDGLHLTTEGQRILGNIVWNGLKRC